MSRHSKPRALICGTFGGFGVTQFFDNFLHRFGVGFNGASARSATEAAVAFAFDAADVFFAILRGEGEVGAEAVANVVAIQDIRLFAHVEEFALQFGGDGRFAGAGEPSEPDDSGGVAVAAGAMLGGDFAVTPENIIAAMGAVTGAFGITIAGDNAAASDFKAVHNNKATGRDDFGMGIKGNGSFRAESEFGDLIAADEDFFFALARNGFERGRIDDALDGFDFAFDFLGGQFDAIDFSFAERLAAEPEETNKCSPR